jgi:anaerobic selenocysteine-containing dehydrogenase
MLDSNIHRSVCRLCPASCGILVRTQGDHIVEIRGDADHPLSGGYTCVKGREQGAIHHSPRRLWSFEIGRRPNRVPVDSNTALNALAADLRRVIEQFGPDAVAIYRGNATAQDAVGVATLSAFASAIGTRSRYSAVTLDSIAKNVVSALMTGYRTNFLNPIPDFEGASMLLCVGVNPVVSHGHDATMSRPRVRLRRIRDEGGLWVIDPRDTATAQFASRHVRPRPGSDYAILGHAVREILSEGADREYLSSHAEGLTELADALRPFTKEFVEDRTGVPTAVHEELVAQIRRVGRLSCMSGTGLTMAACPAVSEWLLWTLQVVTGSFEEPGGCWFQPGFYAQADLQSYEDADTRPRPGPASRPELPSWNGEYPAVALVDEIEHGNVKALIVVGGNPVLSFPESPRLKRALGNLEVLGVVDILSTETTDLATHILPSLGHFERSELSGTSFGLPAIFGQYTTAAVPGGGDRRPLWWILANLAERLGHVVLPQGLAVADATSAEVTAAYTAHARLPLEELRKFPVGIVADPPRALGWVRDRVLPAGKWRLAPPELLNQLALLVAREVPRLALVPRRTSSNVNTKLPGESAKLETEDPVLFMNPFDASARNLSDGAEVQIRSEHGAIEAQLAVTDEIIAGCVSLPHGYAATNVNDLTTSNTLIDSLTGMPLFSGLEVDVAPKAETPTA